MNGLHAKLGEVDLYVYLLLFGTGLVAGDLDKLTSLRCHRELKKRLVFVGQPVRFDGDLSGGNVKLDGYFLERFDDTLQVSGGVVLEQLSQFGLVFEVVLDRSHLLLERDHLQLVI